MRVPTDSITNVCCGGVICVVVMSFIGYFLNSPWMYQWGAAGMAPNTACCLLVIALAQIQAVRRSREPKDNKEVEDRRIQCLTYRQEKK